MRGLPSAGIRFVLVALGIAFFGRAIAGDVDPTSTGHPAQLVGRALETELRGADESRDTLLQQALAKDPNFEPARWHSGFVKWDGAWRTTDEIAKRAAGDKKLTAYRKRRDAKGDSIEHLRKLAVWCGKNGLKQQERLSWGRVREFDPNDQQAIAALGLQPFHNQWMTPDQIAEASKTQAAMDRWQPLITENFSAKSPASADDRAAAIEAFRTSDDPLSLTVLGRALWNVEISFDQESSRALVEMICQVKNRPTAQALVAFAMKSRWPDAAALAVQELKKRPMHTYVPLLLAQFPEPTSTVAQYQYLVLPSGVVTAEMRILHQTAQAEYAIGYDTYVDPTTILFHNPRHGLPGVTVSTNPQKGLEQTAEQLKAARQFVVQLNARERGAQHLRDRLRSVLRETTGFADSNDPKLWEKQWDQYCETYRPKSERPYRRYVSYGTYVQPPEVTVTQRPAPGPQVAFVPKAPEPILLRGRSCFAAGTLVPTLQGELPIEKVGVGDLVLAQHQNTGELAYKMVSERTLRPRSPMVAIRVGRETIRATRGHPFWVNGKGWTMAKQLEVGDVLHSLHGAVVIDRLQETDQEPAYNLVVNDFDTFFVGDARLLVHDNQPLSETACVVPGLQIDDSSDPAAPATVSVKN